ncbi:hypothetical protein MnTg04_00904 [bacterium MnTg04]|nr:hypothetical protein MnTg04_00904 [bacterium MnTg04]
MLPPHEGFRAAHIDGTGQAQTRLRLVMNHHLAIVHGLHDQLFGQPHFTAGYSRQQRLQIIQHDWLGQAAGHPKPQAAPQFFGRFQHPVIQTADQEDRGLALLVREIANQLDAVSVRHLQIHDDIARVELLDRPPEMIGIVCQPDLESLPAPDLADKTHDFRFIIDYQQPFFGFVQGFSPYSRAICLKLSAAEGKVQEIRLIPHP